MILNVHPATYMQELSDELLATTMASSEAGLLDRPGGVFIRRADLLKPEEITLSRRWRAVQVTATGSVSETSSNSRESRTGIHPSWRS